jgi:hypothetical protein
LETFWKQCHQISVVYITLKTIPSNGIYINTRDENHFEFEILSTQFSTYLYTLNQQFNTSV